jgi:hypothetical protein
MMKLGSTAERLLILDHVCCSTYICVPVSMESAPRLPQRLKISTAHRLETLSNGPLCSRTTPYDGANQGRICLRTGKALEATPNFSFSLSCLLAQQKSMDTSDRVAECKKTRRFISREQKETTMRGSFLGRACLPSARLNGNRYRRPSSFVRQRLALMLRSCYNFGPPTS